MPPVAAGVPHNPTTAETIRKILIASSGNLVEWFDFYLYAFFSVYFAKQFFAGDETQAFLASAGVILLSFFMRPLGGYVFGRIADRYGRKNAFSLTLLMFALFTVLGALSPNFGFFVAFRFLAGVGLGGCIPVDYALVGEFTPARYRGRVLTAMDGWWPVGAALSFFVSGWVMATSNNWRACPR